MFNHFLASLPVALFREGFLAVKENPVTQEPIIAIKEEGVIKANSEKPVDQIPDMLITPEGLLQAAPERIIVDEIPEEPAFWRIPNQTLAAKLTGALPSERDIGDGLVMGARTGERGSK